MVTGNRVDFVAADEHGVARLVLVRPQQRNAIDAAWCDALAEALDQAEAAAAQASARVLLVSAEGPAFTVGGDLHHIAQDADRLADKLVEMIEVYHDGLARLAELELPVVCAAHGAVAGGGLGLLWASDLVIAADDLQILTAFAALGLSGDGGSTWYLPRLVGLRRAFELEYENRRLGAQEALEWGLVTRVVPSVDLAAEAERTARALAAGSTKGFATMRRLLRQSSERTLREGLAAELQAMHATGDTPEAAERVRTFAARAARAETQRPQ